MNITSSSDLTLDEMTEASDRIHREVGDEADIIWGQTFDEELGDEMRITVIATGIGMEEPGQAHNIHQFDPNAQAQPYNQQPQTGPASHTLTSNEPSARGHVRTPTEAELANWNEFDNPVILKPKKAVGSDDIMNDYGNIPYDNNDLEVPTFLRRKAD